MKMNPLQSRASHTLSKTRGPETAEPISAGPVHYRCRVRTAVRVVTGRRGAVGVRSSPAVVPWRRRAAEVTVRPSWPWRNAETTEGWAFSIPGHRETLRPGDFPHASIAAKSASFLVAAGASREEAVAVSPKRQESRRRSVLGSACHAHPIPGQHCASATGASGVRVDLLARSRTCHASLEKGPGQTVRPIARVREYAAYHAGPYHRPASEHRAVHAGVWDREERLGCRRDGSLRDDRRARRWQHCDGAVAAQADHACPEAGRLVVRRSHSDRLYRWV